MVDRQQINAQPINIQIGDVSCSVECQDSEIAYQIQRLYADFPAQGVPEIRINLETIDRFTSDYLAAVSPQSKQLKWGDQVAAVCQVDACGPTISGPCITITVERYQLSARYEYKVMNTLLPAVYYTMKYRTYKDYLPAMIVHACSIIRKGRGVIFTGPSETGKTTVARLCGTEHGELINDEMVLLADAGPARKYNKHYQVQGIPIIGGLSQRMDATTPVSCIFMLKQAERTSVRPLDRVDAYLRLIRQIIAPRDLMRPEDTRSMLDEISHFVDEVTKLVPCFELAFSLDKEALWRAVEEIEQLL